MSALPADQTVDDDVQPYARAYLAAHPDRVFSAWQFIVWMGEQWRTWAAETGVQYGTRPKTPAQHQAFGAWLADRWATSGSGGGQSTTSDRSDTTHRPRTPGVAPFAAASLVTAPATVPTPSGPVGLSLDGASDPSQGRRSSTGEGEPGGSEGPHAPPAATPSPSDCICGHGPMVHARYGCCTAAGCRCDRFRKRRHTNDAGRAATRPAS